MSKAQAIVYNILYFLGLKDDVEEEELYLQRKSTQEVLYPTNRGYYDNKDSRVNTFEKMARESNMRAINDSRLSLTIKTPKTMDDSRKIIDELKHGKAVIVNLQELEDQPIKRSVFDFIVGGLYSLEGYMKKVDTDIFVLAPHEVDIDNNDFDISSFTRKNFNTDI